MAKEDVYLFVVDDDQRVFKGIQEHADGASDYFNFKPVFVRGVSDLDNVKRTIPDGAKYFAVVDMIMETSGSGVEVLSKLKSALTINRTGFCGAVVHTSLRSLKLEILRKNSNLGNDLEAIIVKEQRDGLYGGNVIDYLKEKFEKEY
ncbi:hypothetical protein J4467_01145 [Candidatus Woesearchaeota archaeon]|nr:hypothetical protein [Candidatus Woesearchaeota archaeon]